jgi:hypothetical protein
MQNILQYNFALVVSNFLNIYSLTFFVSSILTAIILKYDHFQIADFLFLSYRICFKVTRKLHHP